MLAFRGGGGILTKASICGSAFRRAGCDHGMFGRPSIPGGGGAHPGRRGSRGPEVVPMAADPFARPMPVLYHRSVDSGADAASLFFGVFCNWSVAAELGMNHGTGTLLRPVKQNAVDIL